MYRGTDRPTLLHTGGYGVRTAATLTEVARLIGGNQLNVEQRFFTPSIPDPADWTELNIWQAATDHHRLVRALKPVLQQRWLSSGGKVRRYSDLYQARSFIPRFFVREDPWAMPEIDLWVRFFGSELLFV